MSKNDAATAKYWQTYDEAIKTMSAAEARRAAANAAMPLMQAKVEKDMLTDNKNVSQQSKLRTEMLCMTTQGARLMDAPENGAYVAWPYDTTKTVWSTVFTAPAANRDEALVYVHVYDRYGNQYTNILQRDLQDLVAPEGAMTETGKVEIHENGGSGLTNMKITEYAYGGSGGMLPALEGASKDLEWNSSSNSFTVTGLGQGSHNYVYSLYFQDAAGYSKTINFRASPARGGSVTIKVSDGSKMTGRYGEAAANPIAGQEVDPDDTGDASPMTMMTVEEVPIAATEENTIVGAGVGNTAEAQPVEQEQEIYSFTLNEIYTVNLFVQEGQEDYDLTLKSTAGGIVKTYVNGTFAPVKGGKVTVPGGSEVQIRVAAQAGYELESLTMTYSDGDVVDLLGAYTAEISDDVTICARFRKTDTLLRVTVENGTIDGREGALVSPYSQVTVVAADAPEGRQFAYWAQGGADGPVVSYDDVYTFLVTGDTDLTAVYSDVAVAREASIVMDPASESHITVVNGRHTLSYSGKITLPEGAQIEEFGMVLTNQSADDCTDENLVIGGAVNGVNNVKLIGESLTENGQCKLNVNNVRAGQTRTGRLFLTVKYADGTIRTLYSDTWSELTTPEA